MYFVEVVFSSTSHLALRAFGFKMFLEPSSLLCWQVDSWVPENKRGVQLEIRGAISTLVSASFIVLIIISCVKAFGGDLLLGHATPM